MPGRWGRGPRPDLPLGWADLAGVDGVGIWGFGVEGRASRRRLEAMGIEPVLVDDRPREDDGPGVVATDDGGLELLARCEVVIKTPGISCYRPDVAGLIDGGTRIVGGLGLWLAGVPLDRVVCVTGTKGKSTTTSIAGHLAGGLGRRPFVGGNLGLPPFDPSNDVAADADLWIIEVSSYQATDIEVVPPVVAVTSLHADHLDWHGGEEAYFRDKLALTQRAGARLTIASGDDERLRARRDQLGPEVQWVTADDATGWAGGLGLLGRHNAVNAAIARAVLVAVGVDGADDDDAMAAAAVGFAGLGSRLRSVRTIDGVDFVDDSLATNVLPTIAAIDSFPDRAVAVLLGGHDRGIDYGGLAAHLAARARSVPTFALTLPASGDRIADAIDAAAGAAGGAAAVEVRRCADLDTAVDAAFAWARSRDGVVLLSPAAPSFGQFRDYIDRAAAFTAAADRLAATP